MERTKHVIALIGSTRKASTNLNLVKAISVLAAPYFSVTIFEELAALPHFNPDLDYDTPPQKVVQFRQLIRSADGILICTPEYAKGVPGTLKNAIDWTVSSCEFSHKPTALITASSLGEKGHASLLETLKIIESAITDDTQLLISHASTKVNHDCEIVDDQTLIAINKLIRAFSEALDKESSEVSWNN